MDGIAIVGMAGRFPGAPDIRAFWENLRDGVVSIRQLEVNELEVPDARRRAADPNYIRARAILDDADRFDAAFFNCYPQEAALMDPQQRVFLECCWSAIEDAGYDPKAGQALTGIFAGASPNTYFLRQVIEDRRYVEDFTSAYQIGFYPAVLGSIADTLATRVAHKLNLQGPAMTVLTACSTSLVAVCQAAQSLLTYQCDAALAGGVSITFPQQRGYDYQPGGMGSSDGACRTFDAAASGTVFGAGCGVVLLKRLEDALADGDSIYAVIRGWGVNNDGAAKAGFTAPSPEGQARAISMAQAMAGVSARDISYIEAHGTATPLGDPIEVSALKQVFSASTTDRHFCALGAAKPHVGHLDAAAGVTGLIKTSLSLHHRLLPALPHFERPNPLLGLDDSPFFVPQRNIPWEASPRLAGVSAFGVGGTNAHVVLEEAPSRAPSSPAKPYQLLTLSAKSETALEASRQALVQSLDPACAASAPLADVAYTLHRGRHAFDYRRFAVTGPEGAVAFSSSAKAQAAPQVFFLFPGQGAQYKGMGRGLYQTEAVFRDAFDRCARILKLDLAELLYGTSEADLNATSLAQPALFAIEYSLAQLFLHWGITPAAMLGHSVGEFVAACLAGVFSLEDALALVAERGRLMQDLPSGAMLAVRLPAEQLRPMLSPGLSLAAHNAPSLCVAAGPLAEIDALEARLTAQGFGSKRLHTSHAFHSAMVDPVVEPLTALLGRIPLAAPRIPYVSSSTGQWIRPEEATSPAYWARHCRDTVQFSPAVTLLREVDGAFLLELGPGTTLQALSRQHATPSGVSQQLASALPDAVAKDSRPQDAAETALVALGRLWAWGATPDWSRFHEGETRHRVWLPTYPFERQRFWLEAAPAPASSLPLSTPNSIPPEAPPNMIPQTEQRVLAMLSDLSGIPAQQIDSQTAFLELGFDSLFLTQVTQSIYQQFKVKVTFRQLMEDLSSVAALTAYLAPLVPVAPAPLPVVPAPVPALSVAPNPVAPSPIAPSPIAPSPIAPSPMAPLSAAPTPSAPLSGSVEQLMRDQMEAMNRLFAHQIDALRSAVPVITSIPVTAPVMAPVMAPVSLPAAEPAAASTPTPVAAAPAEFKAHGPYKPIQPGAKTGVTPAQRAALDKLIAAYTSRTDKSKELTQRYRKVLADPRVAGGFRALWKEMVYPITTVRSHASHLWDVDGNEYIDLLNGFGPVAFGHRPDFILDAVKKQLEEGIEIGPQTPLAGEVAELLSELTGCERVTFCNTGSEAVMAAMRVARTVTGRNKIVYFSGDYHGTFDEVLAKRIGPLDGLRSGPIAPGIPAANLSNMIVLEYGDPDSLEVIRRHADDIAAVMVEPVQSRHPSLQPREFLTELRRITEASGSALIFDEIVTGFRSHPGGAQALFGVRADMATYGKVLGGGMPIGALGGSARFMDALDGGQWNYGDESIPEVGVTFFAGTFVRHPLALAAAKAVLLHLKESGSALQEALAAKTARVVAQINQLFERYGYASHAENFGSVFYFPVPREDRFASLLHYHLRLRGIHILEGFPCFVSTAHTQEELAAVVRAFRESLAEMAAGDMLQPPAPLEPFEVPLTEPQIEVWLAAQMSEEANCSFNEALLLHLSGDLDVDLLRQSWRQIVNRHDALRSTFDEEGRTARIAPHLDLEMPLEPLASRAELDSIVALDARTPFDLVQGPLLRLRFFQLAPQEHAVLFTAHHIVCDGWSINMLLAEVGELYSAARQARAPQLDPLLPFSEYARRPKENLAADEQYWLGQYQDVPSVLELPLDRPRPSVKSFAGATIRRQIDPELVRSLRSIGARQGATLFHVLLSGLQVLLSRLSGQEDVPVGIPAAAQQLVEGRSLVGHGVNFLPVRNPIAPGQSYIEFLRQTKTKMLDAYEHQDYTYGTLVRRLGIQKDPSRLPLVEVQFNLEKVGQGVDFAGLAWEADPCAKAYVNFDLFVNAIESSAGLSIDCDYNSALLDRETVERWLGHYETLLRAAAAQPETPTGRLPLLSPAEREALVAGRNRTQTASPPPPLTHEWIAAQAAATPHEIAVVFEQRSLTYAQLEESANQLAATLSALGAGPGAFVALHLERGLDLPVAMLAVLKSGAAYIPLDPAYPKERIDFIVEESQAKVILTEERLATQLSAPQARIVCLDLEWPLIRKQKSTPSAVRVSPADLAYAIYTSGSTGKPKGVEIPHGALANFLRSMLREPGLTAADRLLAVTTVSFDIAGLEIFLPLVAGARTVIAGPNSVGDGQALADLIAQEKISALQATPGTWRLLLEAGWQPSPAFKMMCGGEALPRDLANSLATPGAELWNMYGPTETTIWSSVSRVLAGPEPIRLGGPIDNTTFYVVDAQLQPVPLGVPGELLIGGGGVARGYCHRPELSAEKFLADPFRPGERVFRTGDMVRALPGGLYDFLGRADNQVKIRGFRIELGEIETVLLGHPAVKECAVVARDHHGAKKLVAYLVASETEPLREHLAGHLPAYMIPSFFVALDRLPRTPNGKIDRKALPAPAAGEATRAKKAPASPTERRLADIFSEVLGRGEVGADESLFELGADSIQMFQIVARAKRSGILVTAQQILRYPTVELLARQAVVAEDSTAASLRPSGPSIRPVSRDRYKIQAAGDVRK